MILSNSVFENILKSAEEKAPKVIKSITEGAEKLVEAIKPEEVAPKEVPLPKVAMPEITPVPEALPTQPRMPEIAPQMPAIKRSAAEDILEAGPRKILPEPEIGMKKEKEPSEWLTPELLQKKLEEGTVIKAPLKERVKKNAKAMYRDLVDEFDPINVDIEKNKIDTKSGAYTEALTYRDKTANAYAQNQEHIFGNILKYNEKTNTGLKDAKEKHVFNMLGTVLHLLESARAGVNYGVSENVLIDRLKGIKAFVNDDKKFERIAKTVDSFSDYVNDEKLNKIYRNNPEGIDLIKGRSDDMGNVITPEQIAGEWKQKYRHYMPIKMVEDSFTEELPSELGGKAGDALGFLKKRGGIDTPIRTDFLEHNLEGLYKAHYAVRKIKLNDRISQEFGTKIGHVYPKGVKLTAEVPQGYQLVKMKTSDGAAYALPNDIADMMNNVHKQDIDIITNMHREFNKIFKLGATTSRIAFSMLNPAKDIADSLMNERKLEKIGSMYSPKNMGLLAKSFAASFLHNFPSLEKYAKGDFLESAVKLEKEAGEAGLFYGHRPDFKEMPFELMEGKDKLGRVAYNTLVLPPEKMAGLGEAWLRLAQFERGQRGGYSKEFSSMLGKDITVNFAKMGHKGRVLNSMIAFLNPMIQGAVNLGSNFKYNPSGTIAKAGAFMSGATALYIYNKTHDTEDFKTVDPYLKNGYFMMNTGIKADNGKPVYGIIGVMPRMVDGAWAIWRQKLDYMLEKDPKARELLKKYSDTYFQINEDRHPIIGKAWNTIAPVQGFMTSIMPPLAKIPVEILSNYDLWRQRNIIPPSKEGLSPEFQARDTTANFYRLLGEKTGTSPALLEHTARSIFPANIQYEPVVDKIMEMAGIQPQVPANKKEISGMETLSKYVPFLRVGKTNPKEQMMYNIWKDKKRAQMDALFEAKMAYDRLTAGEEGGRELFEEKISKLSDTQRKALKKYAMDQYYKTNLTPEDYTKYRKIPKSMRREIGDLPDDAVNF